MKLLKSQLHENRISFKRFRRRTNISDLQTIADKTIVMENGSFSAHGHACTDIAGFKAVAFNSIDTAAINKNVLPFGI